MDGDKASLLLKVCQSNDVAALRTLLNSDTDIKYTLATNVSVSTAIGPRKVTLLCAACESGSVDTARMLLDEGAEVNQCSADGLYPLHCVCAVLGSEGRTLVGLLLSRGASESMRDQQNNTVLHRACLHGNAAVLSQLIMHMYRGPGKGNMSHNTLTTEALHNVLNKDGYSPLMLASLRDHTECIMVLKHFKMADVKQANEQGYTPLMIAARWNKPQSIAALMTSEHCSTLDVQDKTGATALHYAARHRSIEAVKLLLCLGAKRNVQNQKGEIPLDSVASGTELEQILKCRQHSASDALQYRSPDISQYINESSQLPYTCPEGSKQVETEIDDIPQCQAPPPPPPTTTTGQVVQPTDGGSRNKETWSLDETSVLKPTGGVKTFALQAPQSPRMLKPSQLESRSRHRQAEENSDNSSTITTMIRKPPSPSTQFKPVVAPHPTPIATGLTAFQRLNVSRDSTSACRTPSSTAPATHVGNNNTSTSSADTIFKVPFSSDRGLFSSSKVNFKGMNINSSASAQIKKETPSSSSCSEKTDSQALVKTSQYSHDNTSEALLNERRRNEVLKEAIRSHYMVITESLDTSLHVPRLFQEAIINEADMEQISVVPCQRKKVETLMFILLSKATFWCEPFVKSLELSKERGDHHIAREIRSLANTN